MRQGEARQGKGKGKERQEKKKNKTLQLLSLSQLSTELHMAQLSYNCQAKYIHSNRHNFSAEILHYNDCNFRK